MNYVECEKEYKETAQEVNNLIQQYNKQKKDVHTEQELRNIELKLHNLRILRNRCITMAELLSEHKNSIVE